MTWDEATKAHEVPKESWEGRLFKCTGAVYHKRPELSSSDIKSMLISPAHFKRGSLEKHIRDPGERSEAFALGDCCHGALLEQSLESFVVAPRFDRRTKQGKLDAEAFEARHVGKHVLTPEQFLRLKEMFDVAASNVAVSLLLSHADIEQSYLYLDSETGLRCKFRPDAWSSVGLGADLPELGIGKDEPYILDYKTCASASPHEFAKATARYHYHLSAAHYLKGVERLYGEMPKHYILLAQEKEPPFAMAFYRLSASDITRSLELRARVMARIRECSLTNHYPDWSERALTLSVPGYGFDFKEQQ